MLEVFILTLVPFNPVHCQLPPSSSTTYVWELMRRGRPNPRRSGPGCRRLDRDGSSRTHAKRLAPGTREPLD